jgi:energy-coupling factor transport system ATP-binding protein
MLTSQSGTLAWDQTTEPALSPAPRKMTGLVGQFPERQLFARTVAEDVAFAPQTQGLHGAELEARVREALELAGLDYLGFKDRSPFALSGGERRKVALAGILALQPAYVLLDEPTAGLDYPARSVLYQTVRVLKSHRIGVLLVSHRPQDLLELADRILMLEQGRLQFDLPALEAILRIEEALGGCRPATPSRDIMYRLHTLQWNIPTDIKRPADLSSAIRTCLLARQGA